MTEMVALDDALYLSGSTNCQALDTATGQTIARIDCVWQRPGSGELRYSSPLEIPVTAEGVHGGARFLRNAVRGRGTRVARRRSARSDRRTPAADRNRRHVADLRVAVGRTRRGSEGVGPPGVHGDSGQHEPADHALSQQFRLGRPRHPRNNSLSGRAFGLHCEQQPLPGHRGI